MLKGPDNNQRRKRYIWLAVVLVMIALYFPVNRLMQGGVQLGLPLDRNIPLYPIFILPYLAGSLLFVGLPVWAALKAPSAVFGSYSLALFLVTLISLVIYIAFPTYVVRPVITDNDIFSRGMALLYQADRSYNAAPSGHAAFSTLACLCLLRWKPDYKFIWIAGWLIILASTLFTRQHNLLDMVSGIALAGIAWVVSSYIQKKQLLRFFLFADRG